MILNCKKEKAGVLTIPVMQNVIVLKTLVLLPGHNDIKNEDWNLAKANCQDKIKDGLIEEIAENPGYWCRKFCCCPLFILW